MKLSDFVHSFEQILPLAIQETYDNCGLQIGHPQTVISGILYTLDVTTEAIDKAIEQNCNLILSHHPFLFHPVRNIDISHGKGSMIKTLIDHNIAVYSAHTNLDKSPSGLNQHLAQHLGLSDIMPLSYSKGLLKKLVTFCPIEHAATVRKAIFDAGAGVIGKYDQCSFNSEGSGTFRASDEANPFVGDRGSMHMEPETKIEVVFPSWKQNSILKALFAFHPYEEVAFDIFSLDNLWGDYGLGKIGMLNQPLTPIDFIEMIKNKLELKMLRSSSLITGKILKVAVCGGSGSALLGLAISEGANALITSDVRYHDFEAASGKLLLIDAGHYETEIVGLNALKSLVSDFFPNFAPQIIFQATNQVNIF